MSTGKRHVVVAGAGMVGVSCAWALQQRGLQVTLIDRREPGSETSHGNAGVLSPTSLLPFNHPGLWRQLPALLSGRSAGFRTRAGYLLADWHPSMTFLSNARPSVLATTTAALHALISASRPLHLQWMTQAGVAARLRETGWLFLYRSEIAWQAARWAREIYRQYGLAIQTMDPQALAALEPAIGQGFAKALWVQGAASVDEPGEVVRAMARKVVDRGACFVQDDIRRLQPVASGGWTLQTASGNEVHADRVVLALGPWSRDFLQRQWGWRLPMLYERGYHMHFRWNGPALKRPLYDTAAGYVLSPMGEGVRLTTGVELDAMLSSFDAGMLERAEEAAREVLPLGERKDRQAWRGSRPTLPDSRPMIGAVPGLPHLWLALGHQHIGYSTGPATGELLASQMCGEPAVVASEPFSPTRFGQGWLRVSHHPGG